MGRRFAFWRTKRWMNHQSNHSLGELCSNRLAVTSCQVPRCVLLSRAERHVRCGELINTAAYLTLYTRCRVNQCRYNRVRLYWSLWVEASDRIRSRGSLKDAFITIKINVTGKIKLTSSAHSWVFSSSSMKSYAFYDPSISSFVSKILPVFLFLFFFLLTSFMFYVLCL
jgi:hypothetical protein